MQAPTQRELDALKILWLKERATVRSIWNELRREEPELAYTSILSLLQSMEQKGIVRHEVKGRAYEYIACLEQKKTIGSMARGIVERVFDGALDAFVAHALDNSSPSMETLDRLESLVADAKKRAKKRGGRK